MSFNRSEKVSQICHPFGRLRTGSERSEGSGLRRREILRCAQNDKGRSQNDPWSLERRMPKSRTAVTLIEVMAAIVIVAIAVIGASGYRYYSTLDARRADFQNAAARIALLLCENWRGRGYDADTYDPVVHLTSANPNLTVATSGVGPDYASGFTPLGRYEITMDGVHYWAALSWDDDAATAGLRALNVVVAWAQRQTGADEAEAVAAAGGDRTFRLTTYVSQ